LRAAAKHVAAQEHDANLGKTALVRSSRLRRALGDALREIEAFLHKLMNPGHDAHGLRRDLTYALQSVEARYG
jgi:hypothetical protein